MRPSLRMGMGRGRAAGLAGLLAVAGLAAPARGQDAGPADRPADATEAPPVDEFVVLPLRAHVLAAPDLPAADCHLSDEDIRRVVGKANAIWHKAGVHWALGPILREPAAGQDEYRAAREARAANPLDPLRLLAPAGSRSEAGMDVYYIHAFAANGVYLGDRMAFVQETAQLRPVPGGIDEPLPRVTAHELGHALGLGHRQDRTNLLASGTTGTLFSRDEVDRARRRAARFPGARTVPDLRRARAAARDRGDAAEADRLGAILDALPAPPGRPRPRRAAPGAGVTRPDRPCVGGRGRLPQRGRPTHPLDRRP